MHPYAEARPYTTVDGRALVRCAICGSHLEYRDRARHTAFHNTIQQLREAIAAIHSQQPELPPF